MSTSKILKWVTGGLEAFLGFPIIGGMVVLGFAWVPLAVMAVLHIITLIFCMKDEQSTHGSILGIITSFIAWIPFVGMAMHILTAVFLLVDAARPSRSY
ncbi:phosphate starvation-inducible membrane PsiE [Oikeobacillus pervagus]|uniref:Phosphate starvation-inducible membrane PsiE n=1 Tax=Oikeobacillus pervagus TaxID=1325931 RepID=A0AAJ1SWG3_9BACI|nr:hypothetical protein [Oikeobacillus pervagus]MDQ0214103.1 phosphate starvation-inducible membrane PsiE [Oikeobacillus pervagus]